MRSLAAASPLSNPPSLFAVGPQLGGGSGEGAFFERLSHSLGSVVRLRTVALALPHNLLPGRSHTNDTTSEKADAFDVLSPASWVRGALNAYRSDVVLLVQWMPLTLPGYLALVASLRLWGKVSGKRPRLHLLVHDVRPDRSWPMARTLLRLLLRSMDGATVLTREVERDVRLLAPRLPLHRAGHPVYDSYGDAVAQSTARERLSLPADAAVVLFFGHVKPYKGLDVLMDAFPAVRDASRDVHLLVAGGVHPAGEAQAAHLDRLSESLGHITFRRGLVPDEEVALTFCASSICVLPYRRPAASGALQIAAHYERPIVAPRFEAFADVERLGVGVLFNPGDAADLARAIQRALELPAAEVAAGFSEWKRLHSWDRFAQEWTSFATVQTTDSEPNADALPARER